MVDLQQSGMLVLFNQTSLGSKFISTNGLWNIEPRDREMMVKLLWPNARSGHAQLKNVSKACQR